jgi:hypothetical protein
MAEERQYVYQKRPPAQKYVLKNLRTEMIQGYGIKIHYCGMYADFKGLIPEFDVEPEADKILLWELQTGKTTEAERDKRRKQIINEICKKIESHPDYVHGIIWKKKTDQEKIEEIGVFVCEHCNEVKKTKQLLIEHKKLHQSGPIVEEMSHV